MKMLGAQHGMHLEMSRQMAISVANDPQNQSNVDPIDRIRFQELAKIAEIHLREFPSLPEITKPNLEIQVVNRVEWASQTIADWEKYANMFQKLANGEDQSPTPTELPASQDEPEGFAQMIQNFSKAVGPLMMAMQLGSLVGHLAKVAFGSYEIAVPRPTGRAPTVIASNVDSFALDWELPLDQVRLWATLRELVMFHIVSTPLIAKRIEHLINLHIDSSKTDLKQIQDRLTQLNPNDPEGIQAALSDPAGIFGPSSQSDVQKRNYDEICTTMAVVEGIASNAVSIIGSRLLGNSAAIEEAFIRRRIERSDGERLSEQFFGIEITRSGIEQGQEFVKGVKERAGENGLTPLWTRESAFPTPSELAAPGLWLARLEFDQ